jgi:hypothetical protein
MAGLRNQKPRYREGYGLGPEEVAIAVRWLELNPLDEAVPLEAAVKLNEQGGDQRSERSGRAVVFLASLARKRALVPGTRPNAHQLPRAPRGKGDLL